MSDLVEKRGSGFEVTPPSPAGPSGDASLGSLAASTSSTENSTGDFIYEESPEFREFEGNDDAERILRGMENLFDEYFGESFVTFGGG